ncbi:hypothetical protein [Rhodococcus sp. Leaf278]|uniref:hypothetical protein n=1 Tax=Rhodococcus sp. Leaf278 TaxID=1736319 RepID=UPI001F24B1EC|nr:hypothetical protein [Rhodococcus sp. Leaf278]
MLSGSKIDTRPSAARCSYVAEIRSTFVDVTSKAPGASMQRRYATRQVLPDPVTPSTSMQSFCLM